MNESYFFNRFKMHDTHLLIPFLTIHMHVHWTYTMDW